MNTLKNLNDAIEYIENNLCGQIDFDKLFRVAGCSEYHFRRVFSYFAGIPLGEYIRNRRLSIAVALLKENSENISQIAFMLGYETPESFTRAFKAMHNASPTEIKNKNIQFKVFLPLAFKLTLSGGIEMKIRIVEKEKFTIVGYKKRITLQYSGVNTQMNSLLEMLTPSVIKQLKELSSTEPLGIVSVSTNFADRTVEGSELDQYIGVATTQEVDSKSGFDVLEVERCTYAVFQSEGKFPDAIQNTWATIFSQWLPSSGYQLVDGAELLWNESPDTSKPNYKSEIWIPVIKGEKANGE